MAPPVVTSGNSERGFDAFWREIKEKPKSSGNYVPTKRAQRLIPEPTTFDPPLRPLSLEIRAKQTSPGIDKEMKNTQTVRLK